MRFIYYIFKLIFDILMLLLFVLKYAIIINVDKS